MYDRMVETGEHFQFTCEHCRVDNTAHNTDIMWGHLPDILEGNYNDDLDCTTPAPSRSQPSSVNNPSFDCFKKKGMHFLHINARSILPKMDEVRHLAQESKAVTIGITETWLDESVPDSELDIDNYTVIRKDRNRNSGGVCMYIRKDVAFNKRPELSKDTESVWVDIMLPGLLL
jgi:hypothetical protein